MIDLTSTWIKEEDDKYSSLYSNGYPDGTPIYLVNLFNLKYSEKVIDLGCGLGSLSNHFKNYTGVDISNWVISRNRDVRVNGEYYHESLSDLSFFHDQEYDSVICSDVMEHIPENKVIEVLNSISLLTSRKFYFEINILPSSYVDSNGDNLHLTLWSTDKWIEELKKYFNLSKATIKEKSMLIECYPLNN
jgi:cyclopropane fatty-acyl-phospholipid synthase-like methyltransferase